MTDKILPILFENADDISAVDLLLDIEELNRVHNFINSKNYKRLFEYLLSYVDYSADEDEQKNILNCMFTMAHKNNDSYNALRVAIK